MKIQKLNLRSTALMFIIIACCAWHVQGQNVTAPRQSPPAELKQTIGLTEIKVNYSRPNVVRNGQDRTGNVWGNTVRYGYQKINFGSKNEIPWRAGANENTVISFSHDVKIEGKSLKAGKYGLHMAIHEDGKATVIFSENITSWGSFYYDESEDKLRVDVKMEDTQHIPVLTYDFIDFGTDYGILALSWEKKRIPIRIEVDVKEQVAASFRDELRGPSGFGWQAPLSAANYCMQLNFNHEEALGWAERSIGSNKNFNNLTTKAGLLIQMGKTSEAISTADEAAQLASVNQLNSLGYQMMQLGQLEKAVEYFELNVKNNPKDANVHDSLGEAYKAKGEKQKAIKSFRKSLSLNPPQNVKDNSIKNLKELGVEVGS
ncbi:MAG: DUF2911 domain-containing protein [Bacteroidota bacterium]